MTRDEELALLRNKLAASERMGDGYADRVKAVRAAIAALESGDDAPNPS